MIETTPYIPNKIWIVCCKGDSGNWLLSSPTTYYENASKLASVFAPHRETYILECDLGIKIHITDEPVKKIPKKVRKVRQVI